MVNASLSITPLFFSAHQVISLGTLSNALQMLESMTETFLYRKKKRPVYRVSVVMPILYCLVYENLYKIDYFCLQMPPNSHCLPYPQFLMKILPELLCVMR